jgi:hypothetical protein
MDLAHKVIRPMQTVFMPGRHNLEGVVVLHENIDIYRKRLDGVLFKIDFKKANDTINGLLCSKSFRMKGFDPKWILCLQCSFILLQICWLFLLHVPMRMVKLGPQTSFGRV